MSVPQKEKEGPASTMLRAVFAGIGSLLSGKDKRVKPAAEPAPTAAAADTTEPETTAESEAVVTETAAEKIHELLTEEAHGR